MGQVEPNPLEEDATIFHSWFGAFQCPSDDHLGEGRNVNAVTPKRLYDKSDVAGLPADFPIFRCLIDWPANPWGWLLLRTVVTHGLIRLSGSETNDGRVY
jgi:hypothetical protein